MISHLLMQVITILTLPKVPMPMRVRGVSLWDMRGRWEGKVRYGVFIIKGRDHNGIYNKKKNKIKIKILSISSRKRDSLQKNYRRQSYEQTTAIMLNVAFYLLLF